MTCEDDDINMTKITKIRILKDGKRIEILESDFVVLAIGLLLQYTIMR